MSIAVELLELLASGARIIIKGMDLYDEASMIRAPHQCDPPSTYSYRQAAYPSIICRRLPSATLSLLDHHQRQLPNVDVLLASQVDDAHGVDADDAFPQRQEP